LKLCTIGKKIFCTGPTGSAGQFFMLQLPSKIHKLNSVISQEISQFIFSKQSNNASVHKKGATIHVLYIYIYIFIFFRFMFFIAQLHKVQKAMITFSLFVCRLLYI
jgi:hypothetical protein